MSEKERAEKCAENMNNAASGMLLIVYLATFIIIIIGLFKLLHNSKNEPKNRNIYIRKDPSNYYDEGEFCYDNYENFIIKGALDIFDIPIKKIKKYTQALLSTIFISIGSLAIASILVCIGKSQYNHSLSIGFACCFYIFFILAVILSFVFTILLGYYYFKGNYSDFEEFSRCRYLTKKFKIDYNFIFKIKDEFKMPFILILISEFFNFIKLIAEGHNKI